MYPAPPTYRYPIDASSVTKATSPVIFVSTGNIPKAVEALTVLGFTANEVTPLLNKMDSTLPVEQLISAVLKEIGRR